MPQPPQPGETKQEFISRCIAYMHENESDRPREQVAAICYDMWERHIRKGKQSKKKKGKSQ